MSGSTPRTPAPSARRVPPGRTLGFAVKAAVLLLVLAGLGASFLKPTWGDGTMLCFGWAVGIALVLAVIGYRTLRAGMFSSTQTDMIKHVLGGLFLRFVIIAVTHGIWIWKFDPTWGQRALLSTVGLYVFALMLEVFVLQQELKQLQQMKNESADTVAPIRAE